MNPARWIAPALAMAIGLVPAMAVEQQPGADQAQQQQQEITPIDEQRLADLDRTGSLVIVDLDKAPADAQAQQPGDQKDLNFEQAYQDGSLQEDVNADVRYVVFYSAEQDPQAQQQKQEAARKAFEDSGFVQINYYYVLDKQAIEQLQERRKQAQASGQQPGDEQAMNQGQAGQDQWQEQDERMAKGNDAQFGARDDEYKAKQLEDTDVIPPNDKRVGGKSPEGKAEQARSRGDAEIETDNEVGTLELPTAPRSEDQPKLGQYEGRYDESQQN